MQGFGGAHETWSQFTCIALTLTHLWPALMLRGAAVEGALLPNINV